jgi:hypothetical protein
MKIQQYKILDICWAMIIMAIGLAVWLGVIFWQKLYKLDVDQRENYSSCGCKNKNKSK